MKKSKEVQFISDLFYGISREQKIKTLKDSNLYDKEINVLSERYVNGKSIKECAESLNLEEDNFIKLQRKCINKLYYFIHNNL